MIAVKLSDIPAETMSRIKVATMGDSDALKVGQGVIAIGNALGYGQSVTVGYVSALNREVHAEDDTTRHLLQTDAASVEEYLAALIFFYRGRGNGIRNSCFSGAGYYQ